MMLKITNIPTYIRHLLFWLAYTVLLVSLINYFLPIPQAVSRSLLLLILHTSLVYVNINFLFPRFFLKKQQFVYISLGIISVIVLSFAHVCLLPPLVEGFAPTINADLRYFTRTATGMSAIFLLSLLYAFILNFLKREKIEAAIQRRQLESELKFLKAQLNPHFLFNTLNNVYSLCYLKDDKAAPMVMQLSGLMRYMLYDCQEKLVPLSKEVQFLQNFLELQKLKTDWNQDIEFEIEGAINTYQISPLLFLPFFENLSKHSDLDSNKQAYAKIHLTIQQNHQLVFQMENTIRATPTTQKEKSGIGLSNLQKRLDLHYPNQYQFSQKQENGKFLVSLSIQLMENRLKGV